jgi:hypothetical protein
MNYINPFAGSQRKSMHRWPIVRPLEMHKMAIYSKAFSSMIVHMCKFAFCCKFLSMKQGSLFCFVSHTEISQATNLHVVVLVYFKSSWWCVGVHQLGLRLVGATVWKLDYWIIFLMRINKIKTKNYIGIWGCSWCCWKALDESNLIELISQFSWLRCGRHWFWSGFRCWKFKQIAKIGFGRKNQLSPQCVHIVKFLKIQLWKCEK